MKKLKVFTVHGYNKEYEELGLGEGELDLELKKKGFYRCEDFGSADGFEAIFYHRLDCEDDVPHFFVVISNWVWQESFYVECALSKLEWLRLYLPLLACNSCH